MIIILLYQFSIIKYQNNNIIIMHPIIISLLFVATVLVVAIAGVAVLPPHDTGT